MTQCAPGTYDPNATVGTHVQDAFHCECTQSLHSSILHMSGFTLRIDRISSYVFAWRERLKVTSELGPLPADLAGLDCC